MSCRFCPICRVEFPGLIASETSAGPPTERPVEPETESSAALIVVDPADSVLARPLELMVATAWFEDVQLTTAVRF